MSQQNDFKIDPRTASEIRTQITKLAASYTPEWVFNVNNPDAGSVIGLIFSHQMAESIKKLNQVLGKYRTEFVNMLNLSLLSAYPASGVVIMDLIEDTIPGMDVPKGTKLLGMGEEEDAELIVFETVSDVHITNARLRDIIAVSGHFGKIIPFMGEAKRPNIVPRIENEAAAAPEESDEPAGMPAIPLFDYRHDGIEQNGLMLYHKSVFDTAGDVSISVRLTAVGTGADLSRKFADPSRYQWSYYSEHGLAPFENVGCQSGAVILKKSGENKKIQIDNAEYSMIYLKALTPVLEEVSLSELRISSVCGKTAPAFVVSNAEEMESASFMPFGESVSIFDECYIGHDEIFRQQGAMVTMHFNLSLREKLVSLSTQQEDESLKIIKRKPRTVQFHTASTSPERVSIEYFNGTGWRRLTCTQDWTTVFDGNHAGDISISFLCPDDWKNVTTGGYDARAVRLRVTQADNCFLQPCLHKMPVMEDLTLSYSYFGDWKMPHRLRRICGTTFFDLTPQLLSYHPFIAFSPLPYAENALYLGFDRKMEGAPISILFDIEESVHFVSSPIRFEYSTSTGFQRLKVIDHTESMAGVGTVLFMPPSDFAKTEIEGQRRYWVKLVDDKCAYDNPEMYHAVIRSITPNAVEISNVETLPEESFYIDVATPNMAFPIGAQNILSLDVFVNEKSRFSPSAMRLMIEEQPAVVRVEYNFLGDINEFFVRWTEVDGFDDSHPSDRHYTIDRMTSTIHFGDGVSVMIPGASEGAAFTVLAKCCNGTKGNLPQGAVNNSFGRLLYINNIYNPIATYAGSNIESIESAHMRGANIISSKNRLISELDFVREVKAFSTAIDKVKCVVGRDIDGRQNDRLVSLAVMMKDYTDGAYSFNSLRDRLRERLLKKCEATLTKETLLLTEPVYIEISVDVWAETKSTDKYFEIQNFIKDSITAFLEPLSDGGHPGWDIGALPRESQIKMMLQSIKCDVFLRRFIVTARYIDKNGVHESSLSSLVGNPFMIGINGKHTIHMRLS